MTTKHKHLLTCAFLGAFLFGGCSPSSHATTPPESVERSPKLCDLDGGRWCTPCPDGSSCPQEDSGWLCCAGGACIPNVAQADCTGVWGWCDNYSTKQTCTEDGACIETAECHDG